MCLKRMAVRVRSENALSKLDESVTRLERVVNITRLTIKHNKLVQLCQVLNVKWSLVQLEMSSMKSSSTQINCGDCFIDSPRPLLTEFKEMVGHMGEAFPDDRANVLIASKQVEDKLLRQIDIMEKELSALFHNIAVMANLSTEMLTDIVMASEYDMAKPIPVNADQVTKKEQ